mgnify:CR=1 FL=1
MKTGLIFIWMGVLFGLDLNAQTPGNTTLDPDPVIKTHIPTKRVIPYSSLREADVMWSKRVWRTIDIQQKLNFPLFYPKEPLSDRRSLWDIIRYGIETEGSLTPYEINGDGKLDWDGEFLYPIVPPNGNTQDSGYANAITNLLYNTSQVQKLDEDGEPMYDGEGDGIYITNSSVITSENIMRYLVKEDWFFDKERSIMEVRIIGILPVVEIFNTETGTSRKEGLFWIYFPEARYVFANHEVYNNANDGSRLTFEDLFRKRIFSGFIYKETNVYDNRILDDYTKGTVRYPLFNLEEGLHKIKVRAWDVSNNSAEGYTEFVVSSSAEVALEHVLNYPNPFMDNTAFQFEHNLPNQIVDVQIRVFSVSGRLVKTIDEQIMTEGTRVTGIQWDGTDEYGDQLGRGVYLYKVNVRTSSGYNAYKFEKLVILK